MIVQDVIDHLQQLAPLDYAEDFDNVGLLVGDKNQNVTGVLVTLDTLESVVDEAIEKQCNLIVSFHPIIFKGLKKINGSTYVERVVIKAIQHSIAIFAIHTALDNAMQGVNHIICNTLNLSNQRILIPQHHNILKLQTYVPKASAEHVKSELFNAGAGHIGNYSNCSFSFNGLGTFKGNTASNPSIGQKGVLQHEKETAISVTFLKHNKHQVLRALFEHHPYEEVAYELTTLNNAYQNIGIGMIGELQQPMLATDALQFIKKTMKASVIRHSEIHKEKVRNIAVLGGSGSFAITAAKQAGVDIFVTADLKYHDFYSAENQLILADIGHYESEHYTKSYLTRYLSEKISNIAIILSNINTNPIKYV